MIKFLKLWHQFCAWRIERRIAWVNREIEERVRDRCNVEQAIEYHRAELSRLMLLKVNRGYIDLDIQNQTWSAVGAGEEVTEFVVPYNDDDYRERDW